MKTSGNHTSIHTSIIITALTMGFGILDDRMNAQSGTTAWQKDSESTMDGNWDDPENWTDGVPGATTDVYIDNGHGPRIGSVDVTGTEINIGSLAIGNNGHGVVSTQASATLNVAGHIRLGYAVDSSGIVLMENDSVLTAAGPMHVGYYNGAGEVELRDNALLQASGFIIGDNHPGSNSRGRLIIAGAGVRLLDGNDNALAIKGIGTDSIDEVIFTHDGNLEFPNNITGTKLRVIHEGSGTTHLTGLNTYGANTYLRDGVIVADSVAANPAAALGISTGTIFYDNHGPSAATLRFLRSGTLTQRQIVSPGATAYLEAVNDSALTVTAPALATGTGAAVVLGANALLNLSGNITFASNTAAIGGAIHGEGPITLNLNGGDIIFSNNASTDTSNSTPQGGAAIHTAGTSSITITGAARDLKFTGNNAWTAAAIFTNSAFTIDGRYRDIIVDHNNALNGQGAITAHGGVVISATAHSLVIASNTTKGSGGSAIYAGAGEVLITGSYGDGGILISRNFSTDNGGAIEAGATSITAVSSGTLEISHNDSHAGVSHAGAISGAFKIGGSYAGILLVSNTALYSGGVAYTKNGNIVITATTGAGGLVMTGNKAGTILPDSSYSHVGHGGVFNTSSGDVIIGGEHGFINIANNTAGSIADSYSSHGGAIFANNRIDITANTGAGGLSITGNRAEQAGGAGGALIAYKDAIFIGGTHGTGGITIDSNYAGTQGGVAYALLDIAISATTAGALAIANNAAGAGTGGAFVSISGAITIDGRYDGGILIDSNTGGGNVGALYARNSISITADTGNAARGLSITGNYTPGLGGAFYAASGSIIIGGSHAGGIIIDSNTSGQLGGALLAGVGSVTIDGSRMGDILIIGNVSGIAGGAICSGSDATIRVGAGSTLSAHGNKAGAAGNADDDQAGGFLYVGSGSILFDIGANALAQIGDASSAANHTDSIAAGDDTVTLAKSGAGTLALWANNTYEGGTEIREGVLVMKNANAIGAGTVHIAQAAELRVNTGAITFSNTLSGAGLLAVDIGGAAFDFAASAGNAFTGTVRLGNATMRLGTANTNAWALANSTLQLLAGSTLVTRAEARALGGLDMGADSVIIIDMDGVNPAAVLQTGTLAVNDGARVALSGHTGNPAAIATGPGKNFLDQDTLGENATLLIAANDALLTPDIQVDLYQSDGVTKISGDQYVDYGNVVATYGFIGLTATNQARTATPGGAAGLYYDYLLTALDIKDGTTLVLDSTGAEDKAMSALLTGAGSLDLVAGAGHIILTHSNSYTGTTTITSGTVMAGAGDALGQTAWLALSAIAAYDLNGNTQMLANGAQIDGTLHGSGSLGLGGLASVTSINANFDANVGVTGTTVINNTRALGGSGTLFNDGLVRLDSASGAFSKTLAGTGNIELLNGSAAAVTGANTAYSGTFAIDAHSRLVAETDANLGAANLSGDGVLEKQNATTTITITHANTGFTGATIITAGTLALENLLGAGTGAVVNNDTLVLSGDGDYANSTAGAGTNTITGSVNLTGASAISAWDIQGSGTVTTTANLGAGSVNIDGLLAARAASPWVWGNVLTGTGILKVDTYNKAFDFAAATGNAFAGTLELRNTAYDLSGDNTAALANATLQIDTGANVATGDGVQQIGNLTLASGTLGFTLDATGAAAAGVIRTGILDVRDTVIVINTAVLADNAVPLLQQDEGKTIALVESATLAAGSLAQITGANLLDHLGNQITDAARRDINQSGQTVASGTHDYAVVASNTGLHLAYELTHLDLLDGKITTLTEDNTILQGADELHARISGDGSLRIEANDTITLNNANTYTGTTFVDQGVLKSGVDNALGATAQLYIAAGAAWDLNNTAQTIAGGGAIAGNIFGPGILTLASGTLHITSANTAYAAATNINAAATARITNADALGVSAIALDGVLVADTASSGTMRNTLAGAGRFEKINTGTLTLAAPSPDFAGSAAIVKGSLAATRIDSLGTAGIAVDGGAIFAQTGVTGALQNALSGAGTHVLAGSAITLGDPALYRIGNTVLDASSRLVLAADGIALGALRMNGGALVFANLRDTARIETLGDSAGNFFMNADLSGLREGTVPGGTIANFIDITTDDGAGAHSLHLVTGDTQPAAMNTALELIRTSGTLSTFVLASPRIESELTELELVRGDGSDYTPDAHMWYLADRGLSHAADAIINTASALALDWAQSLNALHLRMGDIRAGSHNAGTTGNLWVRSRGYRVNTANALSGMGFKQYGWGVTAGADKTFAAENGANLLGAFIDMGSVSREFDNAGAGQTRNAAIGIYATVLKNSGWFIDGIARLDRYSSKFDARAYDGRITRGKYAATGQSLSIEAGKRIQCPRSWWVEPGIQMAVLWLNGTSYSTQAAAGQRAIGVRVGDSETWQYRALLRFGKQIAGSKWRPYGKLALVAVDSNGGKITAHNKTFKTDYDGTRAEFGLGTTYRIDGISQLYLDYEYAKAAAYERPWSLNLGYRRLW